MYVNVQVHTAKQGHRALIGKFNRTQRVYGLDSLFEVISQYGKGEFPVWGRENCTYYFEQ